MGDDKRERRFSLKSWEICMTSLLFCIFATMLLVFLVPVFVRAVIDIEYETRDYVAYFALIKMMVSEALSIIPTMCCYLSCQYLIYFCSGSMMVKPSKHFYTPDHLKLEKLYRDHSLVIIIAIMAGLAAVLVLVSLLLNVGEDSKNVAASNIIAVSKALCFVFWVLTTILHVWKSYSVASSSINSSEVAMAV